MQIGEASELTGVSAKMIRHYESIGLIPEAGRRSSNYRDYGAEDVHRLGFIRRARDLGFSIDEIRDLLRLWADRRRSPISPIAATAATGLIARSSTVSPARHRWAINTGWLQPGA